MRATENNFRTKFCEALTATYGGEVYHQKNHGSEFSAGLPDVEVTLKGRTTFVEFKAVADGNLVFTKQPTKLQMHTLGRIERASPGNAWVAYYHRDLGKLLFVPYPFVLDMQRTLRYVSGSQLLYTTGIGIHDWRGLKAMKDWYSFVSIPWPETAVIDAVNACPWGGR